MIPEFVDAQEMQKAHPDTFEAPSKEELDELKPEDFIKICVNQKERFWAVVEEVNDDEVKAIVDNDLLFTEEHGLSFEDTIEVEKRHIYNILKAK